MSHTSANTGFQQYLQEQEQKDLVRVLACGSVDDGKSTLIGRLFHDTDQISLDTLESLKKDSQKHGIAGKDIDPALLTDGLVAEREQGITIDVAYRYFTTNKRSFILADTPGHTQYTRNMATAASLANVAILLIDARKGVLEQTRLHSFLVSLFGIKHVILAVNKMDLVDYRQEVFEEIKKAYESFAARLPVSDVHFVPVSALDGENIAHSTNAMPWYQGVTLLHLLETMHVASDRNLIDFRMPVQLVEKGTEQGRRYSGTIASGVVRPGDDVVIFPSRASSTVQSISLAGQSLKEAFAPLSVSLTLKDDVDVSRGDMLMPPGNETQHDCSLEAMVVWMDSTPLKPGTEYIMQHTTKETLCHVEAIRYEMDVNTFHRNKKVTTLSLNSIGRCALVTHEPLAFDSYSRNRTTGSFIVIDRETNRTVGAGVILDRNIEQDRPRASSQKLPPIVWLTGNTGAGKSTLAFHAKEVLEQEGNSSVVVLDGDEMRATISESADLSPEGRTAHNLRVARLAALLQGQGCTVIVSVIAPFEAVRAQIDALCHPLWVYVQRSGLDADDRPYEPPDKPHCTIDCDALSAKQAGAALLKFLGGHLRS